MDSALASTLSALSQEDKHVVVPYEILGEIFAYCDAATLAAVSRVSFACPELMSKLLYTDITLSDAKSIAILLRLEVSVTLSTRS